MTNCRVCARPLRSLISIAAGVGPVCLRKVRAQLAAFQAQVEAEAQSYSGATAFALTAEELLRLSEERVREAYRERLHAPRRPSARPVEVYVDSVTRNIEGERTTVEWINENVANVHSGSGETYEVTEQSCTCPHFIYRVSRHPERWGNECRHMQALRAAREEVAERRRVRRRNTEPVTPSTTVVAQQEVRPLISAINMSDDAAREAALDTWRENRAFDGIWMSRDDAAYERLMQETEAEWEYDTSGTVLGGTGNTFGVEFEMEFSEYGVWEDVARELYQEGLSQFSSRQGYHARGSLWIPTRDGSLKDGGLEIVSPILRDTPEDWEQVKRVLEIAKRHGAKVNNHTGAHVHIGIGPLDHRTFSWQRLARIGVAHERTLYRLGGANSESYRSNGRPGQHRGTSYAQEFSRDLSFRGEISPQEARRRLSNNTRYTIFNTTNIDGRNGRPAIEMRYPNGTLDHRQVQAQVIVANAMVHQAAVLRNNSEQDWTTPRFSETEKHDRLHGSQMDEETAFRRFLDMLGNPVDRKAAAWLWKRGRA